MLVYQIIGEHFYIKCFNWFEKRIDCDLSTLYILLNYVFMI